MDLGEAALGERRPEGGAGAVEEEAGSLVIHRAGGV
jgi:hypothetical protein